MRARQWQSRVTKAVPFLIATIAILALAAFSSRPAEAGFTSVYDFAGAPADGSQPFSSLVQDPSTGNYYGTTSTGGKFGLGTVYCLSGGAITIIHNFSGIAGSTPTCTLVLVPGSPANGLPTMLYGTTLTGGRANKGLVFKLSVTGTPYTIIHQFTGTPDGANPYAGVIIASDGRLYGTTLNGGSVGMGTTYRVRPNGTGYSVTHNFLGAIPGVPPDGAHPYARLLEYYTGQLVGTTAFAGGQSNAGTVFTENLAGTTYANIHVFFNSPDGAHPTAELIEGFAVTGAPILWGTTHDGGATGFGTAYSLGPSGAGYTVEYSFMGGPDGANPFGGLVHSGVTGYLYGTTVNGGPGGLGTVYELMPGGPPPIPEAVVHPLAFGEGEHPYATLLEDSSGLLWSTTRDGGTSFDGTIFSQTP